MAPEVTAAIIVGAVTVFGFIVQGALISRWLDRKRLTDAEQTEVLKGKIALAVPIRQWYMNRPKQGN